MVKSLIRASSQLDVKLLFALALVAIAEVKAETITSDNVTWVLPDSLQAGISLVEVPTTERERESHDATPLTPLEAARLERLANNPKLINAQAVLAPLVSGNSETSVIVTIEPTATAHDLAVQSEYSLNRPATFDRAGAPLFYNLQDINIRNRLRDTVTKTIDHFMAEIKPAGLTVTQRFAYQFGFAGRVDAAKLEQLLAHSDVLRIEEDGLLEPHLSQGIPLMQADTPRATYDGSGVSIAIVDTGIDTSHPRLGGSSSIFNTKVIGGYDTGDDDADPRPNSSTGEAHGTACAGIAAGDLGNSGDYIGGVAPGAKLYALKITAGDGGSAYESDMIQAWEWAITHKNNDPVNPILIISTSFGGGGYSSNCDSSKSGLTTAAANAVAAGITLFASAGNDGYCSYISSPACISFVNSVGAVYDANLGSGFGFCVSSASCIGEPYGGCTSGYAAWEDFSTYADKVTVYSNSAPFLTLFAPSHNAYTTDIRGMGGYSDGDYDAEFGGTSAACPYAAGAAAVLQAAAKARTGSFLTPAEVESYLTTYGTTITDAKVTSVQKPRINLASAVEALPGIQPSVTVNATDATATEANLTTGTFAFFRTGDNSAELSINYTVAGTASAWSDYQGIGTSITFPVGSSTFSKTITPLQDTLVESDETVVLTLTPGSAYSVGTPDSATVTITSDDVASYLVTATAGTGGSISPDSLAVNYGATISFTVTPNAGYQIVSVSGCGGSLSGNTFTTGAITSACTVSAIFGQNSYEFCDVDQLTLSNENIAPGVAIYSSEVGIDTQGPVIIGSDADVVLTAPVIQLNPGLRVEPGARLLLQPQSVTCPQ